MPLNMVQNIIIFISLGVAFVKAIPIKDDLIVTLPNGKIRGTKFLTPNNVTYYGFPGIPYAERPVGSLRFESPQPVKPWDGIRDAVKENNWCIAYTHLEAPENESEDCLYVNVYVPNIKTNQPLPVMFYTYGGAFKQGNSRKSRFGPDFLIEKNVIVVTFNYRVGPLGFLSTGDKSLPGNYGLKDQNLALRWTYKNIKYFGGHPNKITIFGQSSGGTSIGLHLISKRSAGLFRAAIVQSGSALEYWAVDQDPKSKAYAVIDGIPGANKYRNNTQKLKEFLKNRTVDEIVAATLSFETDDFPMPTLEEESDDAFLTKANFKLLETGNFNRVPIMIGKIAQESLMFFIDLEHTKQFAKRYDTNTNSIIPTDLLQNASNSLEVYKKIHSIYLEDGETFSDNFTAAAEFFSENTFNRGVLKHAELASKHVRVYLYNFAYFGRATVKPFIDGSEKATHGSEIPFIFNVANVSQTTDPQDLLVQNRMVNLWTNFAKYLNPTPKNSELFHNLKWPVVDSKKMQYLNINRTLELREDLGGETYRKWNKIYDTYGKKPFVTF